MLTISKQTQTRLRKRFGNDYRAYIERYASRYDLPDEELEIESGDTYIRRWNNHKLYFLPEFIYPSSRIDIDVPNTNNVRKAIADMLDSPENIPYPVALCLPYRCYNTRMLRRRIEDVIDTITKIPARKFPASEYVHTMRIRIIGSLEYKPIEYVKEAAWQLGLYDANNI